MINRLFFAFSLVLAACFGPQANADWIMDFGPGLGPDITNFEINPGANFTGTIAENHTSGHTWTLAGSPNDPDRKINIRYEFPSLYTLIENGSLPDSFVRFSVPLNSNSSEGVFFVVGTAERASGGSYTFTNDSGGTPGDPTGDFEWETSITMTDLASDDIVALNFEVTFDFVSGAGLNQVFTFGGPGGLIAAPEPSSVAMIGCALVGLVARRRRKA